LGKHLQELKIHDRRDEGLKNSISCGLWARSSNDHLNIERTNPIIVDTLHVGRGSY